LVEFVVGEDHADLEQEVLLEEKDLSIGEGL